MTMELAYDLQSVVCAMVLFALGSLALELWFDLRWYRTAQTMHAQKTR